MKEATGKLMQMQVDTFAEVLGSDAPAPGGGSAAALAGVLGAALVSMVCALTQGKEKYKDSEELVQTVQAEATRLRLTLTEAVDRDTAAFEKVSAAFGMPKSTEEEKQRRSQAIQDGLIACIESPLGIMRCGLDVLKLAERLHGRYNSSCASDLGVGVLLVRAGVQGAWLNVRINLGSLKDREKAASYEEEARGILEEAAALAETSCRAVEAIL